GPSRGPHAASRSGTRVPIRSAAPFRDAVRQALPRPVSRGGSARMPSILVVEDSNVMQMFYSQILSKIIGYQVSFAHNGRQALDHIKKAGMPDVVVLDINMAVMDGL